MKPIILSKSAWHYRLLKWVKSTDPNFYSICPYFWTIVTLIVFFPLVILVKYAGIDKYDAKELNMVEKLLRYLSKSIVYIIAGIFILSAIIGLGLLIYGIITKGFTKNGIIEFLILMGVALSVCGIVLGTIYGSSKLKNSHTGQLIGSYLEAKKNGICPQLLWKDESPEKTN